MVQTMTGVLVLIASPGDASDERVAVRDALHDWNITRGRREEIVLLPWLWEKHAVPKMGGRGQSIINEQAVVKADVVLAFFDSRLGTSTGLDVSGTAEEIRTAVESGKPVHVYFSEEDLPRDVDLDQLQLLQDFKTELREGGLLGSYTDPADLAGQVVRAIEADIEDEGWDEMPQPTLPVAPTATPPTASTAKAVLKWRHERLTETFPDSKGRMKSRTRRNALLVSNAGAPAQDIEFTVSPVGGTQFVFPDPPEEPFTLGADSTLSWTLIPTPSMGSSGNTIRISATWSEDGEPQEQEWTVALE